MSPSSKKVTGQKDWYPYLLLTHINGSLSSIANKIPLRYSNIPGIDKQLVERYANQNNVIYAFDVFDSILRRRIDPPGLVHKKVAQYISQLLSENKIILTPQYILQKRRVVELEVSYNSFLSGKDAQYSAEDVIKKLMGIVDPAGTIDFQKILDYELDLEMAVTDLVPGIIGLLERIRLSGCGIIAITETYLSKEQLKSLFKYHDILKYFQELCVSSDLGRSKQTGRLFSYAAQQYKSPIVYIGDSFMLDYYNPSRFGYKTYWLHNKEEIARKRNLKKQRHAGNSIKYLNTIINLDHNETGLSDIGHNILGPALTTFVYEVAQKAKNEKIDILYFVARDGYTLKKIYDILTKTIYKNVPMPASKYLCLSRKVIKSSCVKELSKTEIDDYLSSLNNDKGKATFSKILLSYGLTPSRLTELCREYGIDMEGSMDQTLSNPGFSKLLENPSFKEITSTEFANNRQLLIKYLDDLSFFKNDKVALVDFNGEGVTLAAIRAMLSSEEKCPKIYGYYFNLFNKGTKVDLDNIEGVVFDWRKMSSHWARPFVSGFACIGEFFTHPNHGVTIGYIAKNGKVTPVFRRTSSEDEYDSVRPVFNGILKYAKEFGEYFNLIDSDEGQLLKDCRVFIRNWITYPPIKHVNSFKNIYTSNDWPEEKTSYFCYSLTAAEIITGKRAITKITTSLWPQGTLKLLKVPGLLLLYNSAMSNTLFFKILTSLKKH